MDIIAEFNLKIVILAVGVSAMVVVISPVDEQLDHPSPSST